MKKNYITPEIEIARLESDDIICASAAPAPETLTTEGVSIGDAKIVDLMN